MAYPSASSSSSDFRVASFSAGGVVQGASYKLQSGRWLIHQALLGHISVLHHLARGVWYKVQTTYKL